jgi:hypothetical protein
MKTIGRPKAAEKHLLNKEMKLVTNPRAKSQRLDGSENILSPVDFFFISSSSSLQPISSSVPYH